MSRPTEARLGTTILTEAEVRALSDGDVIYKHGPWPASFTTDQARAQLLHEARGCPLPFEGAEWDGYTFRGPSWLGHSTHLAA